MLLKKADHLNHQSQQPLYTTLMLQKNHFCHYKSCQSIYTHLLFHTILSLLRRFFEHLFQHYKTILHVDMLLVTLALQL